MSAIEANVESVYGRATIHLKGYLSGDAPEPLEAAFAQTAGVQQILLVFQPLARAASMAGAYRSRRPQPKLRATTDNS